MGNRNIVTFFLQHTGDFYIFEKKRHRTSSEFLTFCMAYCGMHNVNPKDPEIHRESKRKQKVLPPSGNGMRLKII